MNNIKELKLLTENLNLLYIEDDKAIQTQMTKYLSKLFLRVEVASNGLEGLDLFEKGKFDVIITDIAMPKMNGIDMIKKIKEIDERQAIIITTAYSDPEYLLDAIKAHVDGYIMKPFDFEALNFELCKIAETRKKTVENKHYKEHLQEMIKIQSQEISNNYDKTIYAMVELIEQRDTYTAGHSKRVSYYCVLVAKEMGYDEDKCEILSQAGRLHDIGKIETPDSVLLNPKSLNDLEYKLIQEHVSVSYNLLLGMPMFEHLAEIVHAHHERHDGRGYPQGLKGDEINKLSRIMILADAFDAMTTNRIYKGRKSVAAALEEISSLSGKQFHPDVVKSALICLKDVVIDDNINQLPKTKLEKERFAYFYKDNISEAYNQNYLDVVLLQNSYESLFTSMGLFSIKGFASYNKEHGWQKGDQLLIEVSNILCEHFSDSQVFRIFGDDFAVVSKNEIKHESVVKSLDEVFLNSKLTYRIQPVDLKNEKIENLKDIESILTL